MFKKWKKRYKSFWTPLRQGFCLVHFTMMWNRYVVKKRYRRSLKSKHSFEKEVKMKLKRNKRCSIEINWSLNKEENFFKKVIFSQSWPIFRLVNIKFFILNKAFDILNFWTLGTTFVPFWHNHSCQDKLPLTPHHIHTIWLYKDHPFKDQY